MFGNDAHIQRLIQNLSLLPKVLSDPAFDMVSYDGIAHPARDGYTNPASAQFGWRINNQEIAVLRLAPVFFKPQEFFPL